MKCACVTDGTIIPVQPQGDQHKEEYYGPEERSRHGCNGITVNNENQALAFHPHVTHIQFLKD